MDPPVLNWGKGEQASTGKFNKCVLIISFPCVWFCLSTLVMCWNSHHHLEYLLQSALRQNTSEDT